MKIQLNTDKNVNGSEELQGLLTYIITEELGRFNDQITRLEVHISDEDGRKEGPKDKRCLLEARIEGMQPIAVTNFANTPEQAVIGAIDKLKNKFKSKIGRLRHH